MGDSLSYLCMEMSSVRKINITNKILLVLIVISGAKNSVIGCLAETGFHPNNVDG